MILYICLPGECVMLNHPSKFLLIFVLLYSFSGFLMANGNDECHGKQKPAVSFVEFQSFDLQQNPLTIKGKLQLPTSFNRQSKCPPAERSLAAVVILHGSAGIDSRGDFYARALNAAGIATLEIDMWEARELNGGGERPPLPIFTYPDAFAALAYLSAHDKIDPNRIGVLGFSWGGVIAMASAEQLYADQFGNGLKFSAHVAHYPVCYAYNNPDIPALYPPDVRGSQFLNLTGAPVLIQIGTEDDYDNGAEHCRDLINDLPEQDRHLVKVAAYEGAYHAWDRLQIPITVKDPFADEGRIFSTGVVPTVEIIPDVEQAYKSRKKAVRFFKRHL